MAVYKTAQREELLRFLNTHSDRAFTVHEIAELIKRDVSAEKVPGESTVYRLIKELVAEGEVKRTVKGNSRTFVYQIVSGSGCGHHLHMKCTVCGKLCHMDDDESREILERIRSQDMFEVDSSTVLMGKCAECSDSK